MSELTDLDSATSIAIVGMAGRFPGAPDTETFWRLVRDGRDGLVDLSDDDLAAAGVDADTYASPEYVRRAGVLDDMECFDAAFFGIGQRDAALMDPQHRHFYECAWAALESAGHVPEGFDGSIGVFAGCGHNTYLLHNLLTSPGLLDRLGWFLLRHTANDKDFLTTGVSYRLDLRGPSVNVQTACSTSLVAVHLAVQSLLALECDMALAGGVTIEVPHRSGYRYHEGEILSPEGRCRAFDARSDGTVLASGVGVVALRRVSDALADGDPILAVIRGSAVNNDGARKVGYLAPSVDGHAAVVREALAVAGVDASTVTLLEAHGTGTRVGDPIEVAALTAAFRDSTDETGFCRLTSTKPNIGHLDTAAGVASLIKVVQALRHRWLPPMAGHTGPSELLQLGATPFTLSGEGAAWETGSTPRRAGISSLGVGGTNAHVVVEEAPPQRPCDPAPGPHLLLVSARSEAAADAAVGRLATHLAATSDDPADVAHTLLVGRRTFRHRRAVTVRSTGEAVARLTGLDKGRLSKAEASADPLDVVLTFPGGGSQYVAMGAGLIAGDERFRVYRDVLDEAVDAVRAQSGLDLRPFFTGSPTDTALATALRQPSASLPAVFSVEVALARQLMAWGVRPRAYVGHSLGEYTAAHLAGVLSLDDALALVVCRSELMERSSGWGGAMATVTLGESELRAQLGDDLSLAAINSADECVVSGPAGAVAALLERLAAAGVEGQLIPLGAAAHSSLLDPILPEFAAAVKAVTLHAPTAAYVSNLSGTWITPEQACDPAAWVSHLRGTVRFADGLSTALAAGPAAVVEVGPGRTLTSYAGRAPSRPPLAVATMRHVNDQTPDDLHLLEAMGRLWASGADADWSHLVTTPGRRRRVTLPTYPFERIRHWIDGSHQPVSRPAVEPAAAVPAAEPQRRPIEEWASSPTWALLPPLPASTTGRSWLVVADDGDAIAPILAQSLSRLGATVEVVGAERAASAAAGAGGVVVVGGGAPAPSPEATLAVARQRWLGTAVEVIRAVAEGDSPRVALVSVGAWTLPGDPEGRAAEALAVGPATVARSEYPDLHASAIDLPAQPSGDDIAAAALELIAGDEALVVLRAGQRHGPRLTAMPFGAADGPPVPISPGSTWLITGGLGAVGGAIAQRLSGRHQCHIVVTSSTPMPPDPPAWRRRHGPAHPTVQRLDRLDALRATGVPVRVEECDVADPAAVRALLDRLAADGVVLAGVVHAAGALADRPLALLRADEVDLVVGAKARGALVLADELARRGGGTLVLTSSTSTILAPGGQAAYVAANSVLDVLGHDRPGLHVVTVQWGVWAGEGMAASAAARAEQRLTESRLIDHPVLHELATDASGAVHALGALTTGLWTVDQHRSIDGDALLPGTAALEVLLGALAAAGEPTTALADVSFLAPVAIPDNVTVPIRVVFDGIGRSPRAIRLDAALPGDGEWRTFVEGTLVESELAAHVDDAARLTRRGDAAGLGLRPLEDLLAGPHLQLHLGPRWNVVDEAWSSDDEALATVTAPTLDEGWRFDAAVADLAVAAGVALLPQGGLWVPASAESVSATGLPLAARTVYARRQRVGIDPDTATVDVVVAAEDGSLLVRISGLNLRRLVSAAALLGGGAPAPVARGGTRVLASPLLALTVDGGIRADEGGEAFERAVATARSRLVVSSVSVEALAEAQAAPLALTEPALGGTDDVSAATIDVVTALWEELLGVSPIGPDDDFFELGGHSLIAVRVVAAVQRRLGVRLGLAALAETPTPAKLAAAIDHARFDVHTDVDAAAIAAIRRPLVAVQPAGSRRPFFVVHGAGGNVLNLLMLARHLPADRPLWGFQAHGNDRLEAPDATIEAMAARYFAAMRSVQSHGPYLLGGYSGGGVVALELSRQVAEAGERVDLVVLFDTYKPEFRDLTRAEKLRNLVRNTRARGPSETAQWTKEQVNRRLRRRRQGAGPPADEFDLDLDMTQEFSDTVEGYQYSVYPVDALLLRAAPVRPTLVHDYRWKGTITGRITERAVDGDHTTMFAAEHTEKLAFVVAEALDAADRG